MDGAHASEKDRTMKCWFAPRWWLRRDTLRRARGWACEADCDGGFDGERSGVRWAAALIRVFAAAVAVVVAIAVADPCAEV